MQTLEESFKNPYNNAALNIMYAAGWLQTNISQALKPLGLSEPQYNVLRILLSQNGAAISMFEIQEQMIQKMSNVSRLIEKLLERKLVSRKECRDNRRRVEVYLTNDGIALLEEAVPIVHNVVNQLLKDVAPDVLDHLGNTLNQIRNGQSAVQTGQE